MPNSHDVIEELSNEVGALRREFADMLESPQGTRRRPCRGSATFSANGGQTVRRWAKSARHRGEEFAEEAEHMIADRPVISTLAALGVGLLIGSVIQGDVQGPLGLGNQRRSDMALSQTQMVPARQIDLLGPESTVPLLSGGAMPVMGLGTWKLTDETSTPSQPRSSSATA